VGRVGGISLDVGWLCGLLAKDWLPKCSMRSGMGSASVGVCELLMPFLISSSMRPWP